jgi:hypothetical protein
MGHDAKKDACLSVVAYFDHCIIIEKHTDQNKMHVTSPVLRKHGIFFDSIYPKKELVLSQLSSLGYCLLFLRISVASLFLYGWRE